MIPLTNFFIDTNKENIDSVFEAMDDEYSWLQKLRGYNLPSKLQNKGNVWEQDPLYHAEGNVWIHTKMVLKSLFDDEEYHRLSEKEQFILFCSCILHDVSKPETYELSEEGRVSNKGHSRLGALEARKILWLMNIDSVIREQVANIIKVHQLPFYLINRDENSIKYNIVHNSLSMSNKLLCIMARADINGRIMDKSVPNSKEEALTNIDLYEEYSKELNCHSTAFQFYNEHSKRQYFIDYNNKEPNIELFSTLNDNFVVNLMCGLPASGKSTFIKNELSSLPKIELDAIRIELGIKPTDNQGLIKQESLKRAKELLAKKQSFVWDGVNLDFNRRSQLIDLFCSYGAKVRIIFVETSYISLRERNNTRTTNQVPVDVINKMIQKWDVPTLAEAHEVLRIIT